LKKENERFEHIITEQRDRIESHLKEVTDSINYARRLQNALLPPREKWTRHLPDSFLLYIPKDIVAGDFYWMETSALSSPKDAARDSVVLFAAADCTGHGVPGAMVSVICSNALNKAVLEEGNTDPARILDRTRELVIEQFGKAEEEVKDGMDISLCALNGNTLHWAGANNPLWLVRNGELQEFKPNKQPIGRFSDVKPFTTHTIPLQKGDTLFVFTDGFQDQFGGEKGKKFKASHFKELLLSVNNESMERQCALIKDAFEHWRGDLEQIDDVCVIGVRL
jgi:serine phosphatase RsbU (regulator of sigma subunit)